MVIPFKTLRFDERKEQIWGVNFLRRNRRLNEDSYWAPVPRIHRLARVSLAGTLEGLAETSQGKNVQVTPYVKGGTEEALLEPTSGQFDAGVDAKLGIGTGLSLDLTLNTDFSEVEADQQQVNLTRFSLLFPEKRDFFLENSGLFRFGPPTDPRVQSFITTYGSLGAGASLRGGQSRGEDLLLFFSRRIGLSDGGVPIPVRGGGRLTGRHGKVELGFLNIQAGDLEGLSAGDNFTVLRARRNIFSNSDVGVMFIDRETMDSSFYNRTFGADANFRLTPQMDLNTYVAKTSTPGLEGSDLAGRIAWSVQSRLLDVTVALSSLQDNFNPTVGFAPRTGVKRSSNLLSYHLRQTRGRRFLREINPHAEFEYFTDQSQDVVSRYLNAHLAFSFQNGSLIEFGHNTNLERLDKGFIIHPTTTMTPGLYDFNEDFIMVFTDPSRALSGNARYTRGGFYSGRRRSIDLGGVLKVGERLTAQAGWSMNDIDVLEGSFTTHLVSMRFNYSFSTNLFLRGLVQYNNTFGEWSSNVRFNFIHRPLSDFFLVYNERRDDLGRRLERALVAKFTYLVDF